ncbi:hypothetical protein MLD38_031631 [Melastoma candidum]|uniref:Uncharacterized protein n=1 Tax=Melastoma candidum TaxID=119954 RepID=A0ACB9MPW2_9MYRT|nr:hypothetical protein MLD38_031631 [Melastoma candidum]
MEGDINNRNELYRECLRNHAASLGSYATDGCGEFTYDDSSPGSLQCVACGCHRNFHRKVAYVATAPHEVAAGGGGGGGSFRGRGGVMAACGRDNTMAEPLDYGSGSRQGMNLGAVGEYSTESGGKKRYRTKFTAEQKEKMMAFAEKLGWRMQRKDQEDEIERFCGSVGISRQVFKVWMHNHKNSSPANSPASTGNASSLTT